MGDGLELSDTGNLTLTNSQTEITKVGTITEGTWSSKIDNAEIDNTVIGKTTPADGNFTYISADYIINNNKNHSDNYIYVSQKYKPDDSHKDNKNFRSDGSITRPFNSIQEAITNANDNSTIFIHSGVYTLKKELKIRDKSLYFIGEDKENTIISSDDLQKDCFVQDKKIYNKTLKWKNLSFKKCRYGISIKSCKEFSIEDCLFINNGWDSKEKLTETIGGYKKLLENGSVNISTTTLSNGKKIIDGGSIYIEKCDKVKLLEYLSKKKN